MCISCALSAYSEWGARISTSHNPAILPPSFPVKPIIFIPFFLAASIAFKTFSELPLVLIAKSTSPLEPMASTILEKTKAKP